MSRVQVGRNTVYGNPSRLGYVCPLCGEVHTKAGPALACFRRYLFWRVTGNGPGRIVAKHVKLPGSNLGPHEFRVELLKLDGEILVCPGCGVDAPDCHARILESAVKWLKDVETGGS